MNWILGLFGGGGAKSYSAPPPQPVSETIEASIDSADNLIVKRMHLLKKANDALKEAKACQKDNRPRAVTLMKQRQEYERQAAVYDGMIVNIERTSMALDSAVTSVQVAKTMQQSTVSMKSVMTEISVAEIDGIADDLDDSIRDVKDLTDALSRPMGVTADQDEMDEAIAQEMAGWDEGTQSQPVAVTTTAPKPPPTEVLYDLPSPIKKPKEAGVVLN